MELDIRTGAVIFDIGGVLSFAPRIRDFEVFERWERAAGLKQGDIELRASVAWEAGRLGGISEKEFRHRLGRSLGWETAQVTAFMDDFWTEYRGTANSELIAYMTDLRARCKVALLSNSFVGAREQQADLCE